jgi:Cu+-exporting ATPase
MAEKLLDPVCDFEIERPETAVAMSEYQGKTYYFCSSKCKREFDQDPERFLVKE